MCSAELSMKKQVNMTETATITDHRPPEGRALSAVAQWYTALLKTEVKGLKPHGVTVSSP